MDLEWRPILEEELAAEAQARIAQIGTALDLSEDAEPFRYTDPTLAEGHAGIALFVANVEREKNVPSIARRQGVAASVLSRALQDIDDRWRTPYLYSGIVGSLGRFPTCSISSTAPSASHCRSSTIS